MEPQALDIQVHIRRVGLMSVMEMLLFTNDNYTILHHTATCTQPQAHTVATGN